MSFSHMDTGVLKCSWLLVMERGKGRQPTLSLPARRFNIWVCSISGSLKKLSRRLVALMQNFSHALCSLEMHPMTWAHNFPLCVKGSLWAPDVMCKLGQHYVSAQPQLPPWYVSCYECYSYDTSWPRIYSPSPWLQICCEERPLEPHQTCLLLDCWVWWI